MIPVRQLTRTVIYGLSKFKQAAKNNEHTLGSHLLQNNFRYDFFSLSFLSVEVLFCHAICD